MLRSMRLMALSAMIAVIVSACATGAATKSATTQPGSQGTATAIRGVVVIPGDQADVHFTCRLRDGEVAISTYQDAPGSPLQPKSSIYVPRDRNTPLNLTAGQDPPEFKTEPRRGFEDELIHQLSNAIIGLEVGVEKTLEIKGEIPSGLDRNERIIRMSLVRKRSKEMRFTPEDYKEKTGREAVVGRAFILDPALPGKVESVSEKEVVVRFSGEQGKEIDLPFGKATIRGTPQDYEIVIHARAGTLVRTGALVGRIVAVDDVSFTIDYGDPFGGEPLLCDVKIESIGPRTQRVSDAKIH
ncbi:MAG: hypothetical protein ABSH25_00475 [Syntrophorhabdales bacterium]